MKPWFLSIQKIPPHSFAVLSARDFTESPHHPMEGEPIAILIAGTSKRVAFF